MPKRRKQKRAKTVAQRVYRRRAPRKNPSRIRRAAHYVGRGFGGMSLKAAFVNLPANQIGMLAATWAAKRFGGEEHPATQIAPETWNWSSYLKGAFGAVLAGFAINALFKRGHGQKVLEGGINLMVNKVLQNEVIQKSSSEWVKAQLGEENLPQYEGFGQEAQYEGFGAPIIDDERGVYMLGQDGQYIPVDERHRLPEFTGALEPVGPLGRLEPVGPLGLGETKDPFARAFFNR